jgi:hypothetical protein
MENNDHDLHGTVIYVHLLCIVTASNYRQDRYGYLQERRDLEPGLQPSISPTNQRPGNPTTGADGRERGENEEGQSYISFKRGHYRREREREGRCVDFLRYSDIQKM